MTGRPPSPVRLLHKAYKTYKARIWSPSSDHVRR